MAKAVRAFADAKGKLHTSPEQATMADLTRIFDGGSAGQEGMSPGIARTVLEKRKEIERIFAEHDELIGTLSEA